MLNNIYRYGNNLFSCIFFRTSVDKTFLWKRSLLWIIPIDCFWMLVVFWCAINKFFLFLLLFLSLFISLSLISSNWISFYIFRSSFLFSNKRIIFHFLLFFFNYTMFKSTILHISVFTSMDGPTSLSRINLDCSP